MVHVEEAPKNASESGLNTEDQEKADSATQGLYLRRDPGYVPFTQDMTQGDVPHHALPSVPTAPAAQASAPPSPHTRLSPNDRTETAVQSAGMGSPIGGMAAQSRRGPGSLSSMMASFKQGFSERISASPNKQERPPVSAQAEAARPEPSEPVNPPHVDAPCATASASGQQPADSNGARTRARAMAGSRAQAPDAAPGRAPIGSLPRPAAILNLSDDDALDDGKYSHDTLLHSISAVSTRYAHEYWSTYW